MKTLKPGHGQFVKQPVFIRHLIRGFYLYGVRRYIV